MFYCNDCAKEYGYPESLCKSIGLCEICGKHRVCNDRPSSSLPTPTLKGELGLDMNPMGVSKEPKDRFSRFEGTSLFPESVMKRIRNGKNLNRYPVITVPASGQPDWYQGARTLAFVYSRNTGNFVLQGYFKEVEEYLKKNYTHYFVNFTLWWHGEHRDIWHFWKDSIGIFTPTKKKRNWKYEIRPYSTYMTDKKELANQTLKFKRLPKRWIPEFNQY